MRSDRAWERLVSEGTCCGLDCQTDDNVTRAKGMVLLGGHLLCPLCHRKWEAHVRKEMGFSRNPCCPRDADGRCLRCTMEEVAARSKLRHLLVRGQLRDLVNQLFVIEPAHTFLTTLRVTLQMFFTERSGTCTEVKITHS